MAKKKPKCRNCPDLDNHEYSDCKKNLCFICGGKGHFSNNCPSKFRKNRPKKVIDLEDEERSAKIAEKKRDRAISRKRKFDEKLNTAVAFAVKKIRLDEKVEKVQEKVGSLTISEDVVNVNDVNKTKSSYICEVFPEKENNEVIAFESKQETLRVNAFRTKLLDIVPLVNRKFELGMLLDTGARPNLISTTKFLEIAPKNILRPSRTKVVGANDSPLKIRGICSLEVDFRRFKVRKNGESNSIKSIENVTPISYNGNSNPSVRQINLGIYEIDFIVCDDLAMDAILGIESIFNMGIVVNGDKRYVQINKRRVYIQPENGVTSVREITLKPDEFCFVDAVTVGNSTNKDIWFSAEENYVMSIVSGIMPSQNGNIGIFVRNIAPYEIKIPKDFLLGVWDYNFDVHDERDEVYNVQTKEINMDEFSKLVDNKLKDSKASNTQKDHIKKMLVKFVLQFSGAPNGNTSTLSTKHTIRNFPGTTPQAVKSRLYTPGQMKEIYTYADKLSLRALIEPAKPGNPWRSAIHLAKKKDGTWRFCIDYRKLNKVTLLDAYPLPNIEEMFNYLAGAKFFSKIDLVDGFWHIKLAEEDKEKTAFEVPKRGLWQWRVLPMGLSNSPATFQRAMEEALGELRYKSCMVFIDDIIIYSKSFQEHLQHLEEVLCKLASKGLYAKLSKCQFLVEEIEFLGHVVTKDGIKADPKKIEAISKMQAPEDADQVRRFLGMAGYYRKFIKNFSLRTVNIRELIKDRVVFVWTKECQQEYDDIKAELSKEPVMAFPDLDRKFILTTDACKYGFGAILSQMFEEGERVIAYASRSTNEHEKNYPATELEAGAAIWAIDKFKFYLIDHGFTLVTDHKALTSFREISGRSAKLERWSLKLQDYQYTVVHRDGKNMPADFLSRHTDAHRVNAVSKISTFIKLQRECKFYSHLFEKFDKLKSKMIIKTSNEIELGGAKYATYVLKEDGRLYHRIIGSKWDRKLCDIDRLCIPSKLRGAVLKEIHNKSHFNAKKLYRDMQKRFYWPRMHKDLQEFCEGCTECQARNKYTHPTQGPLQGIEVNRRFELVHMDIFSGVPASVRGNTACLMITDALTKFTVAVPIKDKTQNTVARKFLNHWVKYLGFPERICTDGGVEFDGLLRTICEMMKVQKHTTTPYHPQGNGQVEAKNQVFINMLSKHVALRQTEWDEMISMVTLEYNCTTHQVTNEVPYFMVYGREPRTPIDLFFKINLNDKQLINPEWRKELIIKIFDSVNEAKHRIKEQQKISRERIIKNISTRTFSVGEEVWIRVMPRTEKEKKDEERKKLKFRWDGPWKIQDHPAETPNCYIVENTVGGKMLVNRKNVKRYIRRPQWMDNVEKWEADVEHMEEIEHLDPPVVDEENLQTNTPIETNQDKLPNIEIEKLPEKISEKELPNIEIEKLPEKISENESEGTSIPSKTPEAQRKDNLSKFRRWENGDICDVITTKGRFCGKITRIAKGSRRGEKSKAWVKLTESNKTVIYTFLKLRTCEHQNTSSVGIIQGIAEVSARSTGTRANGMQALPINADARDVVLSSMFKQLKEYFKSF
ncbi:MAG TPA: reverse transcriptase domain-containing protein [Candidatus Dojkabacteria bacterium]|nr:reverse transcriptase domain-containing protein [Candidatus Dojkabacteria bacterium]